MPVPLRSPFAAAVAVCAVLTGCGSQVAGADPDPSSSVQSGTPPESYTYVLTSSCGERGLIGDYNVVVENGTVVSAESRNARYPYEPDLSEVPTLADLIAKAASAPQSVIEYTVDDAGLPKSLSLDPVPNGIDDEECYRVTGLRESEPGTTTSEPTSDLKNVNGEVTLEVGHCFIEPLRAFGQTWGLTKTDQFGGGDAQPPGFSGEGVATVTDDGALLYVDRDGFELKFLPTSDPDVYDTTPVVCD